jgi:hypothetical protein
MLYPGDLKMPVQSLGRNSGQGTTNYKDTHRKQIIKTYIDAPVMST